LNKLKAGTKPEYQVQSSQPSYKGKDRGHDIFNRDTVDRAPVQQQKFSDPNLDKLDQKKRMEREIFLENQRVATQKKTDQHSQKHDQRFEDKHRAEIDYQEYERQQAMNRYNQSVQQKENYKALGDQIKDKQSVPDPYSKGGYSQGTDSAHADFLTGDSKLSYLKNKQRATGAGYNILTGM